MRKADKPVADASQGPSRARRSTAGGVPTRRHLGSRYAIAAGTALSIILLAAAGCRKQTQQVISPYESGGSMRQYAGTLEPDDGQWVRATKDYANTRYSTLDQINQGNVAQLKLAWTFDTGNTRGEEAAPLVVNNTMYVVT